MKFKTLIICIIVFQFTAKGQDENSSKFVKAIEDNSYFIEEAYNQEDRVVQHINNGYYTFGPVKNFMYSFTQEWPVSSQKHQFSYTVGYSWLDSKTVKGIPDFLLNYRYQLTGHDDFLTMSPRFSIILPTGNEKKGLGNGVLGYQINLPMSKRLTNSFVCHANIGFTLLPRVKSTDTNGAEVKNTNWNINLGGSIIWLLSSNFNFMLEGVQNISSVADASNKIVTVNQTIISPGFRYAIDANNLQIVPGLAFPISIQDGRSDTGLFFYLSFEHPF